MMASIAELMILARCASPCWIASCAREFLLRTMSNVATLGGHVSVGDYAILGGLAAVHQFVRIGAYAFLGGKMVSIGMPPLS